MIAQNPRSRPKRESSRVAESGQLERTENDWQDVVNICKHDRQWKVRCNGAERQEQGHDAAVVHRLIWRERQSNVCSRIWLATFAAHGCSLRIWIEGGIVGSSVTGTGLP
jgi:hypothetical protein